MRDDGRAQAGTDGLPRSPARRRVLRLAGAAGVGLLSPHLLLACSGGTASRSYPATLEAARNAMLAATADAAVPALSASLVDGEHLAWAEAVGTIDAAGTPPGSDTMFGIGSVSKVVCAIAAMILVDRRRLELDAPLVRYLPDFRMASPQYPQVTIRMLLSHSSGFPGTEWRNAATTVPVSGYARQVAQTLAGARLKHLPGEMAVYSNDGFALIELVVAALTGRSYAQFVHDEILAPLGMTHSAYTLAVFPSGSYAPGFRDAAPQPLECLNCHGGGGLYSTPSDMARLATMLMNGGAFHGRRILSAASVAEMARDQTAALPFNPVPFYRYGLGWDGVTQAGLEAVGVTAWHKNGGTTYYTSELFVAPAERLAVFVTGTSARYDPVRLCELILLNALAERGSIAAMPAPLPAVARAERPASEADLAAISGCYGRHDALLRLEAQPDRTVTVLRNDGAGWQTRATGLKLRDDGTYASDAAPRTAYHAIVAEGRRYLVVRVPLGWGHYETEVLHAQRMLPAAPLSAAWQARVGGRWLAVNHHPFAIAPVLGAGLEAVPQLPGYLLTASGQVVDATADDARALMALKIPISAGTDLDDVVIEVRSGEEWLRIGSVLYRPRATVPALAPGSHVVAIGAEGHGEWRKLPRRGVVTIAAATTWAVFDDALARLAAGEDGGSAPLSGPGDAAWLLVHGAAGASVGVTVA